MKASLQPERNNLVEMSHPDHQTGRMCHHSCDVDTVGRQFEACLGDENVFMTHVLS